MRKIFAIALLCGLGFIPATSEARNHGSSRPSFFHMHHENRSFRFDSCQVHGRDCYRFWFEARRCYLYWYPGATSYAILTPTGLVPLTAAVLPGATVLPTAALLPTGAVLPTVLPTATAFRSIAVLPGFGSFVRMTAPTFPLAGPITGLPPLPTGIPVGGVLPMSVIPLVR
ncbi:MAG: hypothetical protein U0793_15870 [Gemmataceae bacterium]